MVRESGNKGIRTLLLLQEFAEIRYQTVKLISIANKRKLLIKAWHGHLTKINVHSFVCSLLRLTLQKYDKRNVGSGHRMVTAKRKRLTNFALRKILILASLLLSLKALFLIYVSFFIFFQS